MSQLGYLRRGHSKLWKVPGGVLGALVCVPLQHWNEELNYIADSAPRFKIGTGFDDATRRLLWSQRDTLPGRIVRFKSMTHGVLEAPRHPVFQGFRSEDYSND